MSIKIVLAGNPNSGKTTLFNALTGSNQFVGNWPGVTVEKKEGKLKGSKDVTVTDLPGIYSLSPYTLEEVVSRNYLIDEQPDVILNIVDGTNLERNLFLTTQLTELGIPVVVAVNMMDSVTKHGDIIHTEKLSKALGCKVVGISALKGTGIKEASQTALEAAKEGKTKPRHSFSGVIEHTLAHIEEAVLHDLPDEQQRWYAIKLFERDEKIIQKLNINKSKLDHIEQDIKKCEIELDDDSEGIITTERYNYIDSIISDCIKIKNKGKLNTSDKIDRVVTNRWFALPIFAVIMFLVYFISVTTVGTWVTDWTNDGLFGDGFHITGAASFEEATRKFETEQAKIEAYLNTAEENGIDISLLKEAMDSENNEELDKLLAEFYESTSGINLIAKLNISGDDGKINETLDINLSDFQAAFETEEPDPALFGIWVTGVPVLAEKGLNAINCNDWLQGLIIDGIIGGVGAVLGFVPQMLVLFIFLAFLEACGYMARIAFILDRIFRKFGLSGKSFIPILIGTGCGVPGIMASRTIENERDRRMTIITTTFIPCGAKLPIIAMIAGALFSNAWWVAPSAYFIGIAAIILSGIILKKTRLFAGDVAPFVMELPAYRLPSVNAVLRSMWERGWSFIKKAGTIILLSCIFIWFVSRFGWNNGYFGMLEDEAMDKSILAFIGKGISWLFAPLGWNHWKAAVAAFMGMVAKENVVGTFGILFGFAEVAENGAELWGELAVAFTALQGFSILVFNLLCAPCFAALGAIKREMNSPKWFWFAIAYQCIFAYIVSLCIYQFGNLIINGVFGAGTIAAFILAAGFLWLLFRKPSSV